MNIFSLFFLLGRGFTWNNKPYFLRKIKVNNIKVLSAAILLGTLRVNKGLYSITSGHNWNEVLKNRLQPLSNCIGTLSREATPGKQLLIYCLPLLRWGLTLKQEKEFAPVRISSWRVDPVLIMKGFPIQGSDEKALEVILSLKSRLYLLKDFHIQGSNEKVSLSRSVYKCNRP